MKNTKNIIISALLIALVAMSIGYAAFAQTLEINGTAEIKGSWDVEITGITSTISGTAANAENTPTFTKSSATFSAELSKPGDSITYVVTIENKGSIDAKLDSISLIPQETTDGGSAAILYNIVSQPAVGSTLAAGASTTVEIQVTYDANATAVPTATTRSITGTIEYVQA